MVVRFYGVNYVEDIDAGAGGTLPTGANLVAGPSNGVASTGKDIEIAINLGANVGTTIGQFVKDNRSQVIAKLQNLVDDLASGRMAWPPAYT
jgi:hypothetical protein